MKSTTLRRCAQAAYWLIERNPTYLASAVCMTVGARMLLVDEDNKPGMLRLIILTLVALQVYEWCVSAILVALYRSRRSPEDEPSLLLIAALFWTGPLITTMEMCAQDAGLGLVLAGAACLIALGEFQYVRRTLRLRISVWTQIMCSLCVLTIGIAQPALKIAPGATETNEVLLYGLWWLLSAIALLAVWSVRAASRQAREMETSIWAVRGDDLFFAAITLATSAAHLVAMNHAFFGNARVCYAAPLILAITIVGVELAAQVARLPTWASAGLVIVPVIGLWMAKVPFDPEFPLRTLPAALRDPQLGALVIATSVWLYALSRLRRWVFVHAVVVAAALTASRACGEYTQLDLSSGFARVGLDWARDQLGILLYCIVLYLLLTAWLRRSRLTAAIALVLHIVALIALFGDKIPTDVIAVTLTTGWTALVVLHLLLRRPSLAATFMPIAFLTFTSWLFLLDGRYDTVALIHLIFLVVVLFVWGWVQPWTRYRTIAVAIGAVDVVGFGLLWFGPAHAKGLCALLAAFALLAVGLLISWHKQRLLGSSVLSIDPPASGPIESTAEEGFSEA